MEKFHAQFSFPFIVVAVILNNSFKDIMSLIFGLIVCIYILHQGQFYWKIKLNKLMDRTGNNPKYIGFFKQSQYINRILVVFIPIVFFVQFYFTDWSIKSKYVFYGTILANVFAILEYINYYHWQISIDNKADLTYLIKNKRFKKAHLFKDIECNMF
jgi:hypothetical protein